MSIGVIITFFSSFSRLAWACTHVDSCRVNRAERGGKPLLVLCLLMSHWPKEVMRPSPDSLLDDRSDTVTLLRSEHTCLGRVFGQLNSSTSVLVFLPSLFSSNTHLDIDRSPVPLMVGKQKGK